MNDFIVRQGQNEILMVMIQHREGEIVLMIFSMNRVVAEIIEGVMHPAHVPLERKSQPTQVRWTSHLRPGGGFLGDRDDAGKFDVGDVIELSEKINRLQIFPAAKL